MGPSLTPLQWFEGVFVSGPLSSEPRRLGREGFSFFSTGPDSRKYQGAIGL